MKLLFIAEKPLHQKLIQRAFDKCKSQLDYDIDVVSSITCIRTAEHIENFKMSKSAFDKYHLDTLKVPENSRCCIDSNYSSKNKNAILNLISKNHYNFIVNAIPFTPAHCKDCNADLMFAYTLEACDLLRYQNFDFDTSLILTHGSDKDILNNFLYISNELQKMHIEHLQKRMQYKGYVTQRNYDADDKIYFGQINNTSGLVSFNAKTIEDFKKQFHIAVDDYIEICKKYHKK